jgi:hypothetical protein
MTSPDGVNWTIQVSAANNTWRSVTWSPALNLFAAVASSGVGNRVMTATYDRPSMPSPENQISGAGVGVGTLTNTPAAGDPAMWLPITINGVQRYIPAW